MQKKIDTLVSRDSPSSSPILGAANQGRKSKQASRGKAVVMTAKSRVNTSSQERSSVGSRGSCRGGGTVQDAGRRQTRSRAPK